MMSNGWVKVDAIAAETAPEMNGYTNSFLNDERVLLCWALKRLDRTEIRKRKSENGQRFETTKFWLRVARLRCTYKVTRKCQQQSRAELYNTPRKKTFSVLI